MITAAIFSTADKGALIDALHDLIDELHLSDDIVNHGVNMSGQYGDIDVQVISDETPNVISLLDIQRILNEEKG